MSFYSHLVLKELAISFNSNGLIWRINYLQRKALSSDSTCIMQKLSTLPHVKNVEYTHILLDIIRILWYNFYIVKGVAYTGRYTNSPWLLDMISTLDIPRSNALYEYKP